MSIVIAQKNKFKQILFHDTGFQTPNNTYTDTYFNDDNKKALKQSFVLLVRFIKNSKKHLLKIQKQNCQYFIAKLRTFINYLKDDSTSSISKNQVKKGQLLMWLKQYLSCEQKLAFLSQNRHKYPHILIDIFLNILRKQQRYCISININLTKNQKASKQNIKQSLKQWYQQFIKSFRPYVNYKMIKDMYEQLKNKQCKRDRNQSIKKSGGLKKQQKFEYRKNSQVKTQTQAQQKKATRISNQSQALRLRIKNSKCPNQKCQEYLSSRKCLSGNHMIVICDSCKWNKHKCTQNLEAGNSQNFMDHIKLLALGKEIQDFCIKSIPREKKENNIIKIVEQYGYIFTKTSRYIPKTPSIVSYYPILNNQSSLQVHRNRKYQKFLPLQIATSKIPGAGLGVFTTQNINKNMLVCSYLGEIGVGSSMPVLKSYGGSREKINNSIYTLGWFPDDILILAPNKYSNVGRFINSNQPQKCNLKPNICILPPNSQEGYYQFAIILVSTRDIKAKQELFYNYGFQY